MNLPFEQAVATHGETVLQVCRAVLRPDWCAWPTAKQ